MKRIILLLIILLSSINAENRLDSLLLSAVDKIYSIKFIEAQTTINIVKKEYPDNPAGLFFEAMILWWKIQLDYKNEKYDDEFFKETDNVIKNCGNILKKDEKNHDALFYNGGALGFKARVQTFRKEWLKAALNGKNAIPFVHGVYELDTLNKDALLGLGIYDYFADIIPKKYSFVKPFMVFFPDGNAKKGIKELKTVAKYGKFAKYEAQYQLLMIYYFYEKNNKEGFKQSKILLEKFPDNPIFQKYYVRFAYKIGRYKSVDKMLEKVYNNKKNGLMGYNIRAMIEFNYYAGLSNFKQRKYTRAINNNEKIIKLSKNITNYRSSFYYVNTWFNQGMIHYNKRELKLAKIAFNEVLKLDNVGKSRDRASKMLKRIEKREKK